MSLISPADLRAHFETDRTDAALQLVIDAEEAEINRAHGSLANATEIFREAPGAVFLSRPASAIVSISQDYPTGTIVVLDATDYLLQNGMMITRLDTGPNPLANWYGTTTIVYTPDDDTARRRLALIDLCKLRLQFNGVAQESIGDTAYSNGDWMTLRAKIIRGLTRGIPFR